VPPAIVRICEHRDLGLRLRRSAALELLALIVTGVVVADALATPAGVVAACSIACSGTLASGLGPRLSASVGAVFFVMAVYVFTALVDKHELEMALALFFPTVAQVVPVRRDLHELQLWSLSLAIASAVAAPLTLVCGHQLAGALACVGAAVLAMLVGTGRSDFAPMVDDTLDG
jgi:hypothetical protein